MVSIQGIDHINLDVRDLEASIRFYRNVLGFSIKEDERDRTRPYVIVGVEDTAYLALHQSRKPALAGGRRINHWGLVTS